MICPWQELCARLVCRQSVLVSPKYHHCCTGQFPWTHHPITCQVSMERILSLTWQEPEKLLTKLLDSQQGQRPRQITPSCSSITLSCQVVLPHGAATSKFKSISPTGRFTAKGTRSQHGFSWLFHRQSCPGRNPSPEWMEKASEPLVDLMAPKSNAFP